MNTPNSTYRLPPTEVLLRHGRIQALGRDPHLHAAWDEAGDRRCELGSSPRADANDPTADQVMGKTTPTGRGALRSLRREPVARTGTPARIHSRSHGAHQPAPGVRFLRQ